MTTDDIRLMLEETLNSLEKEVDTKFKDKLAECTEAAEHQADTDAPEAELWAIMQENRYIPYDLDINDNLYLAKILDSVSENSDSTEALAASLSILHHQYMIGDLLTKGEVGAHLANMSIRQRPRLEELFRAYNENAEEDLMNIDMLIRFYYTEYAWVREKYEITGGVPDIFMSVLKSGCIESEQEDGRSPFSIMSKFCRFLRSRYIWQSGQE